MSFLSAQGSNAVFNNTTVHDLTVTGKFTIVNDNDLSGNIINIPNNVILETITSPYHTNEIDLSVANQLTFKSANTLLTGNLNMQNHNIQNVNSISGNSSSHVLGIAGGTLLQVAGLSGGIPDFKAQGAYIDWNDESGQGKTNFINNRGEGAGGFSFYNVHTDSSGNVQNTNEVLDINTSGNVTIFSTVDASGTVASFVTDGGANISKELHVYGEAVMGGITTIENY